MLKEAALHFDWIVLDGAPINAVSDTQLIAKDVVGSVCFVVRALKTPERAIVRACSLLDAGKLRQRILVVGWTALLND